MFTCWLRCGSTGSHARSSGSAPTTVVITTPEITLGEALKWAGVVPTGGQAKVLVRGGRVAVNGVVERRRGRRLGGGDRIAVAGLEYRLVAR